jgi:hypothetical protein
MQSQTQTKGKAAPRRKLYLLSLVLAVAVALALALVDGIAHYAASAPAVRASTSATTFNAGTSAWQDDMMMPAMGRMPHLLSVCSVATVEQPDDNMTYGRNDEGPQVISGGVYYYLLKDKDEGDSLLDVCRQF